MLKEKLQSIGALEAWDKMGHCAETVIGKLNEETDAQYSKYEWINGNGFIVHGIPPMEMLKEGYPWEEWYKGRDGKLYHHVLFLEKNEKCNETWDGRDLPAEDQHPESVKGYFWYLYQDDDNSLIYTR